MFRSILIALNLVLLGMVTYNFIVTQANNDDLQKLRENIVQSKEVNTVLERLRHADKSLLNQLPLTEIRKGTINFTMDTHPKVTNPSGCEANRGLYQHQVVFEEAFSGIPEIAFGITGLDFRDGADHRVKIELTDISRSSFIVNLVTWCDTKISFAKADWIAFYSL